MKRKQYLSGLLALSLGLISHSSQADFIGIKIGGGVWDFSPSGNTRYLSATNVDLKNDLQLADDTDTYTYVAVEHPLPFIPNIKIANTNLTTEGTGTITAGFSYGGTTYNVSDTITTKMVLDHQDVTLYYEILDNIVSLDVGLTGKIVDGSVSITRAGVTKRNEIAGTIPMLYAALAVKIPVTGLSVAVEGNALGVGNSSIVDYTAKVAYESSLFWGIEAGVRSLTIELEDFDSTYSNMEFSGPFATLFAHF